MSTPYAPAISAGRLATSLRQGHEHQVWNTFEASVYSTGHSLGGGLAEQFAYALPVNANGTPRVTKVYAFDPSPVTGFLGVRRLIRDENKIGLKMDRIYEWGEVLAIARSIASAVHKPPVMDPEVRQLRYNLFGDDRFGLTNVVAGHSIQQLACRLIEVVSGRTP
jgi:pimeloyl-ACP methyl ester carboxylesterase